MQRDLNCTMLLRGARFHGMRLPLGTTLALLLCSCTLAHAALSNRAHLGASRILGCLPTPSLRIRGGAEQGAGDGMTIVQDDNGDLIIGGGDTVAPEQGGADPKKEGRMGILCVDLGCHNTVAAIR